jgi:hypothetical protein
MSTGPRVRRLRRTRTRGTPLHAPKELGGWETLEMVRRYAHLASDHLLAYAESIESDSTPQIRHSNVPKLQQEVQ